jgi:hypothetical protein
MKPSYSFVRYKMLSGGCFIYSRNERDAFAVQQSKIKSDLI